MQSRMVIKITELTTTGVSSSQIIKKVHTWCNVLHKCNYSYVNYLLFYSVVFTSAAASFWCFLGVNALSLSAPNNPTLYFVFHFWTECIIL